MGAGRTGASQARGRRMNMAATADTTTTPLTSALAITRDMLIAAQEADWEQLQHLEAVREPLLHRQHSADAASRAQIGEVLAFNRQLQALLGSARDTVGRQWQAERDRSQAIAAYAQL